MNKLIKKDMKVVNLKADNVLANDTGKTNTNAKIAPQNIYPLLE